MALSQSGIGMTRVVWATDLHLESVDQAERLEFCSRLATPDADVVILCGDIDTAENIESTLGMLHDALECPLLFVLGNHDFYGGSINDVRQRVAKLAAATPNLHYLSVSEPIALSPTLAVVGHDGWGDARYGDFAGSPLHLNDFRLIRELTGLDQVRLGAKLRQLGDEAADYIRRQLHAALAQYETVLIATHVPPFEEVCLHQGSPSPDGLPFFACQAVGDVIRAAAADHPHQQITVICGHSHHAAAAQIAPNLRAITGGARYKDPVLQSPLDFA